MLAHLVLLTSLVGSWAAVTNAVFVVAEIETPSRVRPLSLHLTVQVCKIPSARGVLLQSGL